MISLVLGSKFKLCKSKIECHKSKEQVVVMPVSFHGEFLLEDMHRVLSVGFLQQPVSVQVEELSLDPQLVEVE